MIRPSQRRPDQLRPLNFTLGYTMHAPGSVLVDWGSTRVLCTVSVAERVPPFLRNQKRGWITAEYGMLPAATNERTDREATRGRQSGRTLEIQRLIGRSLRAAVDLTALGERTLTIDCDVLQADGGTRTAAISGAWVALMSALKQLHEHKKLVADPMQRPLAAVSVGLYQGQPVLDLDYAEDSQADTDMNVVMDHQGSLIELQGTAERGCFSRAQLDAMLDLAHSGIMQIAAAQRAALAENLL